jgi:HlyD family secretion protein
MRVRIHFILWVGSLWALASCRQKTEQTTVTNEKIVAAAYASGTVKSKDQYQLNAVVNGLIKEIYVQEGDTLKKDQPIMKIQNETARLTAENARLAADYANVSNNTDKLNEQKANINLAKSKLANDSALFARQQNLWNQGIGTKNELDNRELALINARTNFEAAQLRLNDLRRQLEFSARQSRKTAEISTVQQNDFIIKAESGGRLYKLLKEKGETVNLQSAIAVIGNVKDFVLELQVDEYDIAKIKIGQPVIVNLDSYKGEVYAAVVVKINPIMDERSRAFTVEAKFTRQPPALYPGLSAEANIILQTKENALTIPRNYLVADSFVLISKGEKKRVIVGIKDYQKVEILGGLAAGEIIYKPAP